MSAQTVTISRLGAQGDGIAHTDQGPLYVPFALPGETVSVARIKKPPRPNGRRRPAAISGLTASTAPAAAALCSISRTRPIMPSSAIW